MPPHRRRAGLAHIGACGHHRDSRRPPAAAFRTPRMLHVTSRDNPLHKYAKRLAQGRIDAATGAAFEAGPGTLPVLLEGVHLCQDWLRHRGQPVRALFDAQRAESAPELRQLLQQVDAGHVVTMPPSLMASISPVAGAQGVAFLVHHAAPTLPARIDHACLWLDRIQDPGNVGTLLRTAAAAGIRHAYLSDGCAAAWSPRVLRAAQGAHFAMTVHEHVDLLQAVSRLSVPLCATALGGGAASLYASALPAQCAWVFGNEGQGVDPGLLAVTDHRFFIPQDDAVESLNVGVAAGICLFEQRRQWLGGMGGGV